MTLKYIWRSFQPRLSFPRPFQQSLACFRVAQSPSNSWASCHNKYIADTLSCFHKRFLKPIKSILAEAVLKPNQRSSRPNNWLGGKHPSYSLPWCFQCKSHFQCFNLPHHHLLQAENFSCCMPLSFTEIFCPNEKLCEFERETVCKNKLNAEISSRWPQTTDVFFQIMCSWCTECIVSRRFTLTQMLYK